MDVLVGAGKGENAERSESMGFVFKNNIETKNLIKYNDIRIVDGCYAVLDSKWNNKESDLTVTRLYYIVDSENAYVVSGGKRTDLLPGYAYVIPSGFHFERHCDRLEKLFFHISLTKENGFDMLEGAEIICSLNLGVDKVNQIVQAFFEGNSVNAFIVKSNMYQCLSQALIENCVDGNEELKFSPIVKLTIEAIKREMNYSLGIKDIADELFVSESNLSKVFKKEIGYTIGEYNREYIMKEAERRLLEPEISVQRVSESLGFCDRFYFSKAFKKRFGVTPVEYRKRCRIINT